MTTTLGSPRAKAGAEQHAEGGQRATHRPETERMRLRDDAPAGIV